jgi:hypothetical protein
MRALYILVKDILFITYICSELNIPLLLPAVIMKEDNCTVVTISNLKKCKHFIMVVNYVRQQQLELGLIQVLKIKCELNNADLYKKKLRDKSFARKADNIILGSPARLDTSDSEAEADTEDKY